jgi:hypothetical protein
MSSLREQGYNDQQIAAAYYGDPTFRSTLAQEALVSHARTRMAQRNMLEGKNNRKNLPPVQRPGIGHNPMGRREAAVRDALEKVKQSPSARNAAALLQARRAMRNQ